jgi:hypothetical protein
VLADVPLALVFLVAAAITTLLFQLTNSSPL